jgi:hypothetical protein
MLRWWTGILERDSQGEFAPPGFFISNHDPVRFCEDLRVKFPGLSPGIGIHRSKAGAFGHIQPLSAGLLLILAQELQSDPHGQ